MSEEELKALSQRSHQIFIFALLGGVSVAYLVLFKSY